MRRRLWRVIPIFAVALLVQLLSPIGAFRFVASAIADPSSSVHLCSAMASADNGETSPTGVPHDGGCCAVCAVGLGGAPMPAAAPRDFAVVERTYQRLVWSVSEQAPPVARAGLNARARAPPSRVAA